MRVYVFVFVCVRVCLRVTEIVCVCVRVYLGIFKQLHHLRMHFLCGLALIQSGINGAVYAICNMQFFKVSAIINSHSKF